MGENNIVIMFRKLNIFKVGMDKWDIFFQVFMGDGYCFFGSFYVGDGVKFFSQVCGEIIFKII